jgi:integrase
MSKELTAKQPRGRRGSGSLFQKTKGNGRWHIQYYVPAFDATTGKSRVERRREYCGLPYAQAQKRLADRLGKISRGEQFDSGKPRTVADLYTALCTNIENNLRPGSRKLKGIGWRWEHLQPVFAHLRVDLVNSALIEGYKKQRRNEGAALATVQRELATLRRMFRYGLQTGTVHNVPHFGLVKENNVRRGYVDQPVYERMAVEAAKEGLWLRALLETAYTYGWRKGELIGLHVEQLDLGVKPTMRLYDSKNGEGRVVPLMSNVYPLLTALCAGKGSNEYVFTRDDGIPVRDFRGAWQNMCIRAAVPCPDGTISRFECRKCGAPMDAGTRICSVKTKDADGYERKCGGEHRYIGLLVHDMRRSAAKRLRESGIHEKLIMDIGGWKTRSMFDRYTITDPEAMRRAMETVTAPAQLYSPQIAPTGQNTDRAGKAAIQ